MRISPPSQLGQVLAVEDDLAGGRLVELQDRAAGRGLAAAGLADETEGLALLDLEGDAVDGLDGADLALEDDALGQREVHHQVVDFSRASPEPFATWSQSDRPWFTHPSGAVRCPC